MKYQTGLSYRGREDMSLAECCLHRRPGHVKYQTGLSYRGKGGHESSGMLLTSKARSCEVSDRTQL